MFFVRSNTNHSLCRFIEESDTRDAWWLELRTEIRSHMKALGCNAVIGYQEHCCIL